jgi:hypothetical protein
MSDANFENFEDAMAARYGEQIRSYNQYDNDYEDDAVDYGTMATIGGSKKRCRDEENDEVMKTILELSLERERKRRKRAVDKVTVQYSKDNDRKVVDESTFNPVTGEFEYKVLLTQEDELNAKRDSLVGSEYSNQLKIQRDSFFSCLEQVKRGTMKCVPSDKHYNTYASLWAITKDEVKDLFQFELLEYLKTCTVIDAVAILELLARFYPEYFTLPYVTASVLANSQRDSIFKKLTEKDIFWDFVILQQMANDDTKKDADDILITLIFDPLKDLVARACDAGVRWIFTGIQRNLDGKTETQLNIKSNPKYVKLYLEVAKAWATSEAFMQYNLWKVYTDYGIILCFKGDSLSKLGNMSEPLTIERVLISPADYIKSQKPRSGSEYRTTIGQTIAYTYAFFYYSFESTFKSYYEDEFKKNILVNFVKNTKSSNPYIDVPARIVANLKDSGYDVSDLVYEGKMCTVSKKMQSMKIK